MSDPFSLDLGFSELHVLRDEASGLLAAVVVHDRTLGPPRGGTRLRRYPSLAAGIRDAARLARAMSHKFALHGLPFGGGKAVILQDDAGAGSWEVLQARLVAYGRRLETLHDFATGPDYGIGPREVRAVRGVTQRMTHGDDLGVSSKATAYGVRVCLEAGLQRALGGGVEGRRVAIQGVGAVGAELARDLVARGAQVVFADADSERAAALASELGPAATQVSPDQVLTAAVDALAPCATGEVLTLSGVAGLRCKVIAGAANNQLAEPEAQVDQALADRGILFLPDPVCSGGAAVVLTGCASDAELKPLDVVEARIRETVSGVLDRASADGTTPWTAALAIATDRLA